MSNTLYHLLFFVDLYQPDYMMANMFENYPSSCIKDRVLVQRLEMFRDVVEAALNTERNQTETQRSYETHSQTRAQI